ncbi:MAG: hypothetical protein IJR49_00755 [Treponema sp.]|nr:hypothetical protein [Treponema sp.]
MIFGAQLPALRQASRKPATTGYAIRSIRLSVSLTPSLPQGKQTTGGLLPFA